MRGVRAAGAIATAVLLLLATAYLMTYEPAPMVGVRWRAGVSDAQRAAGERRFRLVRPRDRDGRTATYDLLDTSRRNIGALLLDPDVEDTARIDPVNETLPVDAPYGLGWMWVGDRLPLLRIPGVVTAIVAACVVALAAAFVRG